MLHSQTDTNASATPCPHPMSKEQLERAVRVKRMEISEILNTLNRARMELGKVKHQLSKLE